MGNKFQVPVSIKARGADIHFWGARRTTSQQVLEAGKAAHGLLCVSEALRADMISLGMPSDGIWCHYTGVDLRHFAPADRSAVKAALGVDRPLIVSVGALIPRKGQSLLLEAVTEVPDAQLVLVGDGPDRASLLSQARELGIAARVRLTGNLGQPDVARWLAAADVMALPSRSEGLANVWLEALASGTPIVICPAGGAQEVLTDTLAGRIVPRCPKKIATALREILSNPPATSTCRAVAEKFSWSRNAETLRDHLLLLSGK
jgi:glycosyltransferase involved in cell wall biosynthesis